MTEQSTSPLIHALDQAGTYALVQEAKQPIQPSEAPPEEEMPFGRQFRGSEWPQSPGGPQQTAGQEASDMLVGTLAQASTSIATQIAQVQAWLRAHPDILHLLDQSMRKEFHQMERRTNVAAILINAAFCILGAIIGLLLPTVIAAVSPLIGH